jgi:hypothetical protein
MKCYFRPHGRLTFELESDQQDELFEQLAHVQEMTEQSCGKCKTPSEQLVFKTRVVDDNKFYELQCSKCGAILAFGSNKKGDTVFPRRYIMEDGEKKFLPDNGWVKWDNKTKKYV